MIRLATRTGPASQAIHTRGRIHRIRGRLEDRLVGLPAWVVVTQLFIGFGWLRAVAAKAIDLDWWTGNAIRDFLVDHQRFTLGWYQPFIDAVVSPGAPVIALAVLGGQLLAGLSLVTGRLVGLGLGVGMLLNLNFLAAGAVEPSAFYLLAQGALILWSAEQRTNSSSVRGLEVGAGVAVFLAGLNLPFLSTIHPADVIADPATMFVFGGSLAALACLVASNTKRVEVLAER